MNFSGYIPDLHTVFLVILILFTLGTSVMTFITLSNAIRLRNVMLTWKAGRLKGYPLFASLFLVFSFSLFVLSVYQQRSDHIFVFACYGWAGINWFVSSFLMSKRYLTDHGIVKNINDPSQTVAWHRVVDFVENRNDDKLHYIFFYTQENGLNGEKKAIRLELDVPEGQEATFKKILDYKLGRRFNQNYIPASGFEQLN